MGHYSFVHEIYHLVDGYFVNTKDLAATETPEIISEIKHFIAEFRAHLAEMIYFKELDDTSDFHKQFLSFFTNQINYDKIYNYTLETLYPTDAESIHLLIDLKSDNQDRLLSPYEVLSALITKYLNKSITNHNNDNYRLVTYNRDNNQINAKINSNKFIRSKIESYIVRNGGRNQFYLLHNIDSIKKLRSDNLFNKPEDIGGGRPRSGGN